MGWRISEGVGISLTSWIPCSYSASSMSPSCSHLLEHEVAPVDRRLRVRSRRERGGRGDDPCEHRRLGRGEQLGAPILTRLPAAGVLVAEVGARGRLDPVGALAEVDRVQILREDLVLGPVALDLIGERRLAELLEDGAAALGLKRVLDELLGDGRGALGRAAGEQVGGRGARHALDVDAVVLVEAPILDRDGRLLHVGGDVARVHQDALIVVEQRPDLVALVVDDDRVPRRLEFLLALELRQVLRDRHHHPEEGGDDREQAQPQEDDRQAQLLDPARLRLAGPT